MDPLNALASLIVGWRKTTKLFEWVKLCFQIGSSAAVTMCFITGTTLVASSSWTTSFGTGLISTAVVVSVFLRRSPLTKGMLFVLPADEAKSEIATDVQIITK